MYKVLVYMCVLFNTVLSEGEYIDFNVENKKSYDFEYQHILYPCSKLYEFCGDYECCPGLQCTDATFEEDNRDFYFERFFCGNESLTYAQNVELMHEFIRKNQESEDRSYLRKYADPEYPDLYNSTMKSILD